MTTVHEAAKLTVSTESGISRSVTNHLGVLEVSGPGLNYLNSHDHLFQLTSSNVPQLSLGAVDNSGIFQLGVDSNGNSILESTHNGQNQNILIQQLGGFVGVGTNVPASTFHIHSTDALIIPVGTTLQRPGEGGGNINASNGMIRYNTTTSQFEGYGPGSIWRSLGGVKDVSGNTYIRPETYPGAGNNDLQFFTDGEERMVINSVGDISMNGDITTSKGYPYYQSLGTEKVVNPPSTALTVHGVNVTAMNKRTRASYASAEACVSTWTARSAPSNYWWSVCWSPELSLFVAVSDSGTNRVMTSPDGITWTARSSAAESNGWISVCWSPELSIFVAVAYSGTNRVMTSPDGITWTPESSAAESNQWVSVCWSPELSIFVAVAQNGTNRVMTSPDGETWTAESSAAETNYWRSVCWSPELSLFVAVSYTGTNRVMTSPDGETWTARLSASESNGWGSVCWSPELSLFVAVSDSGTNRVMTSPDGITWTARSSASESTYWNTVCWSPELSIFVAVAYYGTNRVMTSPDGITWTVRSSAAESNYWRSVCWSPELSIFVAVSSSGTNRVMSSNIGMPNSKSVVKALPTQMTVLPNGNVGIGTTSPTEKLHVKGDDEMFRLEGVDNPYIGFSYGSTRKWVIGPIASANNDFYIRNVDTTSNLLLLENGIGNVGIGTTNPGTALHVHGKTYITNGGGLATPDPGTTGSIGVRIVLWPGSSTSYAYAIGMASSTMWFGIPDGARFSFFGAGSERMRINASGNVGIGTTSPGYKLTVQTGTQHDGIVLRNESGQDLIKLGRETSSRSYIALYNGTSGKVRIDTGGDSYFNGGHVGIGTTNPTVPLQVTGETRFTGTDVTSHFNYSTSENTYIRGGKTASNVLICDHNTNGKVGIGTSSPTVKLHVYGWTTGSRLTVYTQDDGRMAHYSGDNVANQSMTGGQLGPGSWTGYTFSDIDSDNNLAGYMYGGPVWPGSLGTYVRYSILSGWNLVIDNGCSLIVSSDERIKLNIEDVPDDYALYQLRNIPCRYYRYKDWRILGKEKTIGFIAQDVAKIMPMAVKIRPCVIPNIYKQFNTAKIMWEEITDSSNNISYKLYCKQELLNLRNFEATTDEDKYYCLDDIDISGILFRFYVNNDLGTNERCYEIVGNEDETFTFSKKWGSVFCYGYEVQDFHSLDKNKLFALNFSATQEIDKIQQEEVSKLAEQTSRIDTLNTEIVNLNTEIVNLNTEIVNLNTEIVNLNTEIVNLEQKNSLLSKTYNNLSLKMINIQQENQLLRQELELIKQHIGI